MTQDKTREPHYQHQITLRETKGLTSLGLTTNLVWDEDPRRVGFILARYKFVAKMLSGRQRVLEIGCGDAFGTRIVLQEVEAVTAVDVDPVFVQDVNQRMEEKWKFACKVHDILSSPVEGPFDAAYSLDVLEHIPTSHEDRFMTNLTRSLDKEGVLIIGIPTVQSQAFASKASKQGHVNCKDAKELRNCMQKYFHNVFIFSMNDEMVHTGFTSLAHYLFAIGAGRKTET